MHLLIYQEAGQPTIHIEGIVGGQAQLEDHLLHNVRGEVILLQNLDDLRLNIVDNAIARGNLQGAGGWVN